MEITMKDRDQVMINIKGKQIIIFAGDSDDPILISRIPLLKRIKVDKTEGNCISFSLQD